MLIKVIAWLLVATLVPPAIAASPREDFESKKLLSLAAEEIQILDGDQLEAFIGWIANCNPTPGPERDFSCERASEVVDIKLGASNSLLSLKRAIFVIDKIIPWTRSGIGPQAEKDISRRVKVFRYLSDAAADRYESLRGK